MLLSPGNLARFSVCGFWSSIARFLFRRASIFCFQVYFAWFRWLIVLWGELETAEKGAIVALLCRRVRGGSSRYL